MPTSAYTIPTPHRTLTQIRGRIGVKNSINKAPGAYFNIVCVIVCVCPVACFFLQDTVSAGSAGPDSSRKANSYDRTKQCFVRPVGTSSCRTCYSLMTGA